MQVAQAACALPPQPLLPPPSVVFMAHSCYVFLTLSITSRGFFHPVVSLCVTDALLVWGGRAVLAIKEHEFYSELDLLTARRMAGHGCIDLFLL